MFKETKRLTATDTLIGQGTIVEGSVHTSANLRVEGELHGDVATQGEIIIGEFGIAKASIMCQTLTIAGQVHGDVNVSGRLIITPSGQLFGNATVQSIIVQEGGGFNGECKMNLPQQKIKNEVESISKNQESKEERKARQAG